MFRRLKSNLTSFNYYFAQAVGLIPASFIVTFWLYLRHLGYVSLSREQILIYFLLTAPLGFLFFFSYNRKVIDTLTQKTESVLLTPGNLVWRLVKEFLLPSIVDSLPLGFLLCATGFLFGLFSVQGFFLFFGLLLLSIINYVFFCITMAVIGIYLKIDVWVDFFLRFVGVFWSGAYIPLIFLPGPYQTIAHLLPFAFGGLSLQVILSSVVPWGFIVSVILYTLIFSYLSSVLLSRHQAYTQQ